MGRLLLSFALLLAAALVRASPLGPVQRTLLDNGMTLLLLPEPGSPLVSVAMMYTVGARNEAAGTTGLAHYAEHMNFRSTSGLPGAEITDAITRIGGRWTGYTWIDQTFYAETVPKGALARMLDLEAERMSNALYAPEEFRKERTSVIAELHSYEDPLSLLGDAVLAASFEIHPYRHNSIGWLTDVEAVTRDEAYAFYRRFYHPNNAVLAIAGGFEPEVALKQVRERFAALPAKGASTAVRTLEPAQRGERRVVVRRPGSPARVLLAFRAPALTDADFPAMVLFDALLAGGKGFYFNHDYAVAADTPLRLLAHAPDAASHWQASRYPYVWTLTATTAGEADLAALEKSLLVAIAEAGARTWSAAEHAAANRQVLTGWAQDLDDVAGRAHQLAFFEVSGGHAYLQDLPERVARVSAADLRRFVRERLQPEQATSGWFVPTARNEPATLRAPAPGASPTPVPVPAAAVEPAALRVASVTRFTLASGVRVALAPRPGSALVTLKGRLDAGSIHDGDAAGLSATLVELLAIPAPEAEPGAPAITWRLHDEPAALAHTRWIEFGAVCLPDALPAILDALALRLRRVADRRTLPDEWEQAKQAAHRLALAHADEAETLLWQRALIELYPAGSELGRPAWGDERDFAALTLADVRGMLQSHVASSRLSLALAGALDADDVRATLEARFGALGAVPADVIAGMPAVREAGWKEVLLPRPDATQNEIAVVWPGERSRPWDMAATRVLLYLLGETGYAGRLGRALVEPGLVYWVAARLEDAEAVPGFLMLRTAAALADTREVLRRIRGILEELPGHRFTQAELDEARAYLKGKAARSREGSAAMAASALDDLWRPIAAADGLTLDQLQDTARRLLASGGPVAIVAGPGMP